MESSYKYEIRINGWVTMFSNKIFYSSNVISFIDLCVNRKIETNEKFVILSNTGE